MDAIWICCSWNEHSKKFSRMELDFATIQLPLDPCSKKKIYQKYIFLLSESFKALLEDEDEMSLVALNLAQGLEDFQLTVLLWQSAGKYSKTSACRLKSLIGCLKLRMEANDMVAMRWLASSKILNCSQQILNFAAAFFLTLNSRSLLGQEVAKLKQQHIRSRLLHRRRGSRQKEWAYIN